MSHQNDFSLLNSEETDPDCSFLEYSTGRGIISVVRLGNYVFSRTELSSIGTTLEWSARSGVKHPNQSWGHLQTNRTLSNRIELKFACSINWLIKGSITKRSIEFYCLDVLLSSIVFYFRTQTKWWIINCILRSVFYCFVFWIRENDQDIDNKPDSLHKEGFNISNLAWFALSKKLKPVLYVS